MPKGIPPQLQARIHGIHQHRFTALVPLGSLHTALLRPPPVTVHHQGNMAWNELLRDLVVRIENTHRLTV